MKAKKQKFPIEIKFPPGVPCAPFGYWKLDFRTDEITATFYDAEQMREELETLSLLGKAKSLGGVVSGK